MPYKKLKMGYPRRTVAGVSDGDTIKFRNSYNGAKLARLARVNAPEKHQFGGAKATQQLKQLVQGKKISFEQVGWSYGRPVIEARVGRKSVNNAMKRKGY
jgi:endonuclease YncB( thermonuclease family)